IDTNDVSGASIERRQLDRSELPRLAQPDLERIGVFRIQLRVADEDVLLVEEDRERIQLLSAGSANATRVAQLQLTLLTRLVHDDPARKQTVVLVGITLRVGEIEIAIRPLG